MPVNSKLQRIEPYEYKDPKDSGFEVATTARKTMKRRYSWQDRSSNTFKNNH